MLVGQKFAGMLVVLVCCQHRQAPAEQTQGPAPRRRESLGLGNLGLGSLALGNLALGNLALGNLALGNLALGNLGLGIPASVLVDILVQRGSPGRDGSLVQGV